MTTTQTRPLSELRDICAATPPAHIAEVAGGHAAVNDGSDGLLAAVREFPVGRCFECADAPVPCEYGDSYADGRPFHWVIGAEGRQRLALSGVSTLLVEAAMALRCGHPTLSGGSCEVMKHRVDWCDPCRILRALEERGWRQ